MPADRIPVSYYAKGNYFSCSTRAPFSHLIYPVPEPGGLGVHLTIDLGGQAKFGPDVEWVDTLDYARRPRAGRAVLSGDPPLLANASRRRPGPELFGNPAQDRTARRGAAGFRDPRPAGPWSCGAGQPVRIESPGLTSSLAIADDVAQRAGAV